MKPMTKGLWFFQYSCCIWGLIRVSAEYPCTVDLMLGATRVPVLLFSAYQLSFSKGKKTPMPRLSNVIPPVPEAPLNWPGLRNDKYLRSYSNPLVNYVFCILDLRVRLKYAPGTAPKTRPQNCPRNSPRNSPQSMRPKPPEHAPRGCAPRMPPKHASLSMPPKHAPEHTP